MCSSDVDGSGEAVWSAGIGWANHGQRVVDFLAVVGAVIDGQLQDRLAVMGRRNDALDLLSREHDLAVEGEILWRRQLQLDVDVVAVALRRAVDPTGVGLVHPGLDLEAVALAASILPGVGAEIAERDLALTAVELGDLAEFGRIALAAAAVETVEDTTARAVDGVGARFDEAQVIKRLVREERTIGCVRSATDAESGRRERHHSERSPEKVHHVCPFGKRSFDTLMTVPLRRNYGGFT